MPRLYISPSEFQTYPLYYAVASQLSMLPPGGIEQLLARASQRCDSFTHRRLQAPGSTTLSAPASAGATTISVASALTLDDLDEQAVLIGSGATQELLVIASGGVTLTSQVSPCPATITLASPLAFSHSQGETAQFYYQEISQLIHSSNEDPFQEAFTQEAQLAQMHAPALSKGIDLTRIIFMRAYPLQTIYSLQHSYSYDTLYYSLPLSSIITMNPQGWLKVRLGVVMLPGGFAKVTYQGGYSTVPDDVKSATLSYLKAELQAFVNPYGAATQTLGKQSRSYMAGATNAAVAEAEELLKRYVRKV